MKLYWSINHNFGDSLNPWLWAKLLPGYLDQDSSEILVGIGTILNHKIPSAGHKHVFGSGYGYGWAPNIRGADWTIYCVRGPHTAAKLNISRDLAITDPAILIRRFIAPRSSSSDEVIFIPHFESLDVGEWEIVCGLANLRLVNPCDTIENVIEKIRGAKLVISEAMHGAIVADALRVPWIPVKPLVKKNEHKWLDWFESLNLACKPRALRPSSIHELLKAPYSKFREFAKEQLARRRLADRFADRTPINGPSLIESGTPTAGPSMGDRVRAFSDKLVPTLDEMVRPPIRYALSRVLQHRAAEALTSIAAAEPYLSSDYAIEELTQRLEEKLEVLRRHVQIRHELSRQKQNVARYG
jgi:succinoglycan biosynthesis protein ExoV